MPPKVGFNMKLSGFIGYVVLRSPRSSTTWRSWTRASRAEARRSGGDADVGRATATPTLVDDLENVELVRCGARHSAAVARDDDIDPSSRALYLWGANARGQCADLDRETVPRPHRAVHRRADVVVSLGHAHTSFA